MKKSEHPEQKLAGKCFLIFLQQFPHFLLTAKTRLLHWFSEKRPRNSLSSVSEIGKEELMQAQQDHPKLLENSLKIIEHFPWKIDCIDHNKCLGSDKLLI